MGVEINKFVPKLCFFGRFLKLKGMTLLSGRITLNRILIITSDCEYEKLMVNWT